MKIKHLVIPFLLICTLCNEIKTFEITFGVVLAAVGVGKMVVNGVLEAWDFIDGTKPGTESELPFAKHKQKKLFLRLTEITKQIDSVENHISSTGHWTIESIENFMKINTKLELGLHEMTDMMNRITVHERRMTEYADHLDTLEDSTVQQFAEFIVSPNSVSIQSLLDRIHLQLVGTNDLRSFGTLGVLDLMALQLAETDKTYSCSIRQSSQQILIQLYNAITVTELKGYTMMQFSWMLLKSYGKGNYTGEAQLMRNRFNERTIKTQEYLRRILDRADRVYARCDPKHHVKDETYVSLTRLLQGYIENEVDMNNDGTCRETCGHYQFTENQGCYKDLYCARQPKCSGKLLKCQFVDSDMWVCPSSNHANETRRYEYIEYENGRILGKKGSCQRGTDKVDSWWRWLFWHCSYCFCLCDEAGPKSDRFFNLREVISNTTANKVVTGVRFVKKNRVIHMQIQEGELMMRGNINPATVTWKPVDAYDVRSRGIQSGIDYHQMAWDKRAIDLDELLADAGHVVTGVRFRVVGTHLNLEIRVTEMNFIDGHLIDPQSTSIWVGNDNTETSKERRTAITLNRPDVPTNEERMSKILSKTNQYIEFVNTDMDADGAQSTVPYLDAQEVNSEPPVPLAGLGIYFKGNDRSGGFVAPKIITYDFSPHIKVPDATET